MSKDEEPLKELRLVDPKTGASEGFGAIARSKITMSFKLWLTYREDDFRWLIVAQGDFGEGERSTRVVGWNLPRREVCWREWVALSCDAAVLDLFGEAAREGADTLRFS